MRLSFILPVGLLLALTVVLVPTVSAQTNNNDVIPAPEPRQSPVALAATKLNGDSYVRVVYGSPRMRGRDIFGGLVPYGEVWRTGANEATEITFSSDVMFGGQHVEAGTYALFTIPQEDEWTVILNRTLGQWGSYAYDDAADLLRITVPVRRSSSQHEAFTIRFDEADAGTNLVMVWDRARVDIPVVGH